MFAFSVLVGQISSAQNSEIKDIIAKFVRAGDSRSIKIFEKILHQQYRIIISSAKETKIIHRNDYLDLIKNKKIGGEKRTFKIESLNMSENTASAIVIIESSKSIFRDHLQFIKDRYQWRLINNITHFSQRKRKSL